MKRTLLMSALLLMMSQGFAWSFRDLWETRDQQAQKMMQEKQFPAAKERFEQPAWRAAAAFRAKDYKQSQVLYQSMGEHAFYNRGNAEAFLGQYKQALQSYDKALAIDPKDEDAQHNRKIIEALLKKKQDQDKQNQDKQDQNKQDQDKQDQNKQDQDKQDQDKQDQDKQDQDKQDQDKQDQDKQTQDKQDPQNTPPEQVDNASPAEKEQQDAKAQWLNLIPDDPGGLMREKFRRDYLKRQHGWNQ